MLKDDRPAAGRKISVELNRALYYRLRMAALESDKTASDVIRELLDRHLPAGARTRPSPDKEQPGG